MSAAPMLLISHHIFLYSFLCLQIFVQSLLLVYLFEDGEEGAGDDSAEWTPLVSIIVPCFNEEATVGKTMDSLLALNYPADKLQIVAVDDGSTDGTWSVLQNYASDTRVTLVTKENGGSKFHALNAGLEHVVGEVVGCLDADSRVDSVALRTSVSYFTQEDVGAVVPTIVIDEPQGFLQKMQKVEYEVGVAVRRALANMHALYIAPGPFSLFLTTVVKELGGYAFAHHTEDLDIALRIHKLGKRIVYSQESCVYTVAPNRLRALVKQRVRWTTGFLRNMADHRSMLFSPAHGSLGLVILPYSLFSILIFLYIAPSSLLNLLSIDLSRLGIGSVARIANGSLPLFYAGVTTSILLSISLAVILIILLVTGRWMAKKPIFSLDTLSLIVYPIFVAIWTLKSIFDVAFSRNTSWR